MIEANFQCGSLLKAEVTVGQEAGQGSQSGTGACANAGTFTSTRGSARDGANSGPNRSRFDHVPFAHALFLNGSLRVGLLSGMFPRNPGYGSYKGHLSVPGIDFVEAQQQAGVQALFDGADVAIDLLSARDGGAIWSLQIFGQLGGEFLAGFQLTGVERVIQTNEESLTLGYGIGCGHRSEERIAGF